MKRSELHFRKPANEQGSPRHGTNHSKPWNSINDATEERIMMLYASGHSIDSITREVGRARYRVVHVLQVRGVFSNSQMEPDINSEEPESKSLTVQAPEETLADEGQQKPLAVKGPAPEIAIEEASGQPGPPEFELFRKLESMATNEPGATIPLGERLQDTSRWSPVVVDAMCKVIMQLNLYPGMSLEEVQKMVSDSNH